MQKPTALLKSNLSRLTIDYATWLWNTPVFMEELYKFSLLKTRNHAQTAEILQSMEWTTQDAHNLALYEAWRHGGVLIPEMKGHFVMTYCGTSFEISSTESSKVVEITNKIAALGIFKQPCRWALERLWESIPEASIRSYSNRPLLTRTRGSWQFIALRYYNPSSGFVPKGNVHRTLDMPS